jgi:hypothetical protein
MSTTKVEPFDPQDKEELLLSARIAQEPIAGTWDRVAEYFEGRREKAKDLVVPRAHDQSRKPDDSY